MILCTDRRREGGGSGGGAEGGDGGFALIAQRAAESDRPSRER